MRRSQELLFLCLLVPLQTNYLLLLSGGSSEINHGRCVASEVFWAANRQQTGRKWVQNREARSFGYAKEQRSLSGPTKVWLCIRVPVRIIRSGIRHFFWICVCITTVCGNAGAKIVSSRARSQITATVDTPPST